MAEKSALDEKLIAPIPGPGIEPETSCTPWIIVAKETRTLTTQPQRQIIRFFSCKQSNIPNNKNIPITLHFCVNTIVYILGRYELLP